MTKYRLIEKGEYRHPQTSDLVSVKDYAFVHDGSKRFLLLRFFNESDFTVDAMRFTLHQLDSMGRTICRTRVSRESIAFAPGKLYTDGMAIAIDRRCVGFRVSFCEIVSGYYHYRATDGGITVGYEPKSPTAPLASSGDRKERRPRGAACAAFVAAVLIIGLNLLRIYLLSE